VSACACLSSICFFPCRHRDVSKVAFVGHRRQQNILKMSSDLALETTTK
jgi:hypothetical protein